MGVGTKDQDTAKTTTGAAAAMEEDDGVSGMGVSDFTKRKTELSEWRNAYSIEDARRESKKNKSEGDQNNSTELESDQFTQADLCSGGCLDTLAAMRAGFTPIWGSEVDKSQSRMYENLTGGKCLGDTFGSAVADAVRIHYLKSGQPCPNWARLGNQLGEEGETGWMFVWQTQVILDKLPQCFRLEISDNAVNVQGGDGVRKVREALEEKYVLYERTIQMWRYGDPSNRKRLFIIGFDKKMGQAAHEFKWPRPSFDEKSVPVARLIGVADREVPESYWRYDKVIEQAEWEWADRPDKIQVINRRARGCGPAKNPNTTRSWEGLHNGPTALGGGAKSTEINWKSGQHIARTRLTVPIEFGKGSFIAGRLHQLVQEIRRRKFRRIYSAMHQQRRSS